METQDGSLPIPRIGCRAAGWGAGAGGWESIKKKVCPGGAGCRLVAGVHPPGLSPQKLPNSSPPPLLQVLVHAFPHSEPSSCNFPPLAFRVWIPLSLSHDGEMGNTPGISSLHPAPTRILTLKASSRILSFLHPGKLCGKMQDQKQNAQWQIRSCVLIVLYCGLCLHCLLPQFLTAF